MLAHTGIHSHEEVLSIYRKLNRYFNYLMYVTLLVFILGMLAYGQDFSFRDHAFSHLGRLHTQDGSNNILSLMIYGPGMLLSSLICYRLSSLIADRAGHNLMRMAAAGYLLLIVPCDLLRLVHSIGGGLVIGSLWLFALLGMYRLRSRAGNRKFLIQQLILQGSVLPYAFMYAMESPLCPVFQKFALAGLIISLKLVVVEDTRNVAG